MGLRHGLPFDHLLAPNERDVVPRSWRLVHGGGGDPHWFRYPSLLLYSLAPVEAWQRAPSYLAARIVVVAAAAAAVGVTWWVARRLYGSFLSGAVGAAVVAVATTHVAYSHAALPDVPLSLAVVAALGLAASRRSDLAAIASGAAAGLDYAGLLLAVPLVVASWRRWWQLARALALMLVTFVATTPLLVVHLGRAWSDATAERGDALPFGGHVAAVDRLWHTLGPALFVAAAGVVVALAPPRGARRRLVRARVRGRAARCGCTGAADDPAARPAARGARGAVSLARGGDAAPPRRAADVVRPRRFEAGRGR